MLDNVQAGGDVKAPGHERQGERSLRRRDVPGGCRFGQGFGAGVDARDADQLGTLGQPPAVSARSAADVESLEASPAVECRVEPVIRDPPQHRGPPVRCSKRSQSLEVAGGIIKRDQLHH